MYFGVSDREPIINIRAKSAWRSGLWNALREVYGATKEQSCWFHKTGNVLNAMSKSVQAKAKAICTTFGKQRRAWMLTRLPTA